MTKTSPRLRCCCCCCLDSMKHPVMPSSSTGPRQTEGSGSGCCETKSGLGRLPVGPLCPLSRPSPPPPFVRPRALLDDCHRVAKLSATRVTEVVTVLVRTMRICTMQRVLVQRVARSHPSLRLLGLQQLLGLLVLLLLFLKPLLHQCFYWCLACSHSNSAVKLAICVSSTSSSSLISSSKKYSKKREF